jgi:uncharacterized membrane protein YphA (DoxX/SURF4 family)
MKLRGETFHRVDIAVTRWMADHGLLLLRLSIGLIFLWFGLLKFFGGMSPAQDIAFRTIDTITFGFFSENVIIYGLATWEVLIGIGLLFRIFLRETLLLLYLQMLGTFTPVFLFPGEVFHVFPLSLTLEGQYIFKNLVVVSAGIVLGATARGGKITLKA